MQRLLAIDCDARELCYVLATVSGSQTTLESCGTVSLKGDDEGQVLSADDSAKRLQSALSKIKRTNAKVLVEVDRNAVEFHTVTVPPSTDAEVAELVINQVAVDANENAIIDFIPVPGAPDESRTITAAALARSEFDRVLSICSHAGLTAKRMLMRPHATAALFLNQEAGTNGRSLLVNLIADEVDLIVVDQSRVLFFRTVRLPGALGDDAAEQRLLDEIRRTLLIAPKGADETQSIEGIFLFGNSPELQRIVEQVGKDGTTRVRSFDPLGHFKIGKQWQSSRSGRLIPLLGMIADEAKGNHPALDFVNPRRPPKPPNRIRQIAIAAAALLTVGGMGTYYMSERFAEVDKELKDMRADLAEQDKFLKKYADKRKAADAIEEWNSNGIIWLDELRELSTRFPPGRDLVIQRVAMAQSRAGKGTITFAGLAREAKVVARMESALRDARHEVQTPRVEERPSDKWYSWSFDASISLTPKKVELDSLLDEKKPVTKKETDTENKKDEKKEDETAPPKKSKLRKSTKSSGRTKAAATGADDGKSKSSDAKSDGDATERKNEESKSEPNQEEKS